MTKHVHHALLKNSKKVEKIIFEFIQHYDCTIENPSSSSSESDKESSSASEENNTQYIRNINVYESSNHEDICQRIVISRRKHLILLRNK